MLSVVYLRANLGPCSLGYERNEGDENNHSLYNLGPCSLGYERNNRWLQR